MALADYLNLNTVVKYEFCGVSMQSLVYAKENKQEVRAATFTQAGTCIISPDPFFQLK